MNPQDAVINRETCWGMQAAAQPRLKLPALWGLPHTTLDWAAEFRRLANQCKADTFELANAACHARKALPRGEWSKLWRSGAVPFAKRTGEALVRIGLRFGIPNAQTSAHLPTQWTILQVLFQRRP